MRTGRWGWLLTSIFLASCGGVPTGGAPDQGGHQHILQTDNRLYPERATGSSTLSFGGRSYLAERAIDGNPDLEWSSADDDVDPVLVLRFDREHEFDRVRIKTWPGSNFHIEVSDDSQPSDDASRWRAASSRLQSTTWDMEEKDVEGSGRLLRVRFESPPPSNVKHFTVFEIQIFGNGGGGGTTPPSTEESLSFLGRVDRVSSYGTTGDGTPDGHLQLKLNLSRPTEITNMELFELEPGTRAGTGYVWSTVYASRWILGVTSPGQPTLLGHRSTMGTFSAGSHTFDLYAAEPSTVFSGRGKLLQVIVSFGDGSTRSFERLLSD